MSENSLHFKKADSPQSGGAQSPPTEFINRVVTDAALLDVKIVEATAVYVNYWVKHIQPEIMRDTTRLDANWDWTKLSAKNSMLNRIVTLLGQAPKTFCIVTEDVKGHAFPIGMLHLVQDYDWILDRTKSASFIWFLAAAPKALLEKRFACRPRLMSAFIDAGVVVSKNNGHDGRLFLHADPLGKDTLEASYVRCELVPAPQTARISKIRKLLGNRTHRKLGASGVYFYADETIAAKILKLSDPLRSHSTGGRTNG